MDLEYETGGLLLHYNLQFFADDDKTEEPTDKKLSDARDEGQVAKSKELASAFELMTLFVALKLFVSSIGTGLLNLFDGLYTQIPDFVENSAGGFSQVSFVYLFRYGTMRIMSLCTPVFVLGCLISAVISLVQVKWHPTTKPMQPKLSKFSPISGFKRIVSKDSIFELLKSIAKIIVIAVVSYFYVRDEFDFIFVLYDIPLLQAIGLFGNLAINLGIRISVIFLVIGITDYMYEKNKFHKNMMMTKQEVKDEYKNAEGSPEVKSAQRRRMQEASRRRMMQEVPQADVIITNPTHLAVALKYTPGLQVAPVVVAKGEDHLAERIKEVARENNVEIIENKPLARTLYRDVEIGDTIPPELYQAVADVLAYVYKVKNNL